MIRGIRDCRTLAKDQVRAGQFVALEVNRQSAHPVAWPNSPIGNSGNSRAAGCNGDIALTPKEAAAFWQELQRGLQYVGVLQQPPAWRRRRTGEMRVTITERRAMQAFHLLHGES